MAQDIPGLAPWQRWLYAVALIGGGAAMILVGCAQLIGLSRDMARSAATISTNTAMSAFPPLGIAILVFGTLFVLPRTADGARLRPVRTRRGERDPGAIAVVVGLVCLLLYPVTGILIEAATSSLLEARGYRARIVDPGFHSRFVERIWTRPTPG